MGLTKTENLINCLVTIMTSVEAKLDAIQDGSDPGVVTLSGSNQAVTNPVITTVHAPTAKTIELARPANTDAYTAGDILNANGATALPKLSFGASMANKTIEITGVSAITDYQTDLTKMSDFRLYFYNASTTIYADNAAFAQTYADHIAKRCGQPVEVNTNFDQLATGGLATRLATEICRKVTLDANGDLYIAPIVVAAFTPASGQKFTFAFHYYVL